MKKPPQNFTGLPRIVAYVEVNDAAHIEYTEVGTIIIKGKNVCKFTTTASFPFICNFNDECVEVKTPNEFIKILEIFK